MAGPRKHGSEKRGGAALRRAFSFVACVGVALALSGGVSHLKAQHYPSPRFCDPLVPPIVPSAPDLMRDYADIIKMDFEAYMGGVTHYFRCLDEERARAFKEARIVAQEYGRFLQAVGE
ncbi:MAG: hypothetical protein ACXIUW_17070 [Roseinatronobacter sp.]